MSFCMWAQEVSDSLAEHTVMGTCRRAPSISGHLSHRSRRSNHILKGIQCQYTGPSTHVADSELSPADIAHSTYHACEVKRALGKVSRYGRCPAARAHHIVKVWVMPSIQPGLHQLARHVGLKTDSGRSALAGIKVLSGKAWKLKTSSKVGAKTENCARKAKKTREKLKVAREN
ncbi:hypothetical protein C8F04DRAFT_1189367 [Mycena alexandri]|uniref:Uncharacterized protein n=1 Tax=Mycena alexandri TaxID=1745969 RepID=A0AAD6WWS7_9AGAR|nr:hypothetical protein C8F04DRAFT_1189367 [Mycena alexandri]